MNISNKKLAINGGKPEFEKKIAIHLPLIENDDIEIVKQAIESTFVSGDGPFCREFENHLKKYLNVKHAFFLTNCTAGLDLAFMIKDFKPDSEVIVPNFTYTSTALAPILNNLKVVLVDVYDYNGNIDISKIENKITDKTVAIMPVDYAGNPAEMDEINIIAKKYNLYVVHDTAQSIGSVYKGKKTGNFADISTFSFHGTKNMTTGEGGALVTDNDDIAELIKIAREKGTDKWGLMNKSNRIGFYEYISKGNSYVQSNILGALGVTQLNKIDRINKRKLDIANYYNNELSKINNIKLPTITKNSQSNWHIYYILVDSNHKNWILKALNAEGVAANVHYTPLHMNEYYKNYGDDNDFKQSIKFFNSYIRIPIYYNLKDSEVEGIVRALRKVFE